MNEIVAALGDQHAELASLLDELGPDGWHAPTPCAGWDVADVVLHLAQTDELAVGSVEGRFDAVLGALTEGLTATGVDEGADAMVARERHLGPIAIHERWLAGAATLRAALAGADPHARVQWVAGTMATRTLATTRLAECWIHTTDVAAALGSPVAGTDRLRPIARLAWRTLPYAFASAGRSLDGPVAFRLSGPAGERWDFEPDAEARTVVEGPALDLCLVAGRRLPPAATALRASGADAAAVLELVRTYA